MKTPVDSPSLQERFDALLFSTELANRLVGKRIPGEVTYEESEQGDARRRLLHVEKVALRQKMSDAKAHAAQVEAVGEKLHGRIVDVLKPLFTNGHIVTSNIIGFTDDVTQLLDVLSTRACTVSRLEPIVCGLPWLQDTLLKVVNSPEYRRIDGKGKPVVIESIRTALSAFGIDNLRVMLPYHIFRHASPQVTDPYPQIKNKLAEYYLGVANGAMRLAKLNKLPELDAYTLGFFSGLGNCAAIRQYFREYDKTLGEYAKEAMDDRDQLTYQALQLQQPSPARLTELCDSCSTELTTRVLEYMLFRRLRLLPAWADNTHPLHDILNIATEYAKLKMLIRYRLVDREEARSHLHSLNIPKDYVDELNKPDLFKLVSDVRAHVAQ